MIRFEGYFGKWVIKYRWLIIISTMIIVLVASIGIRFLTFNRDNRVFFSKDNPQLKALEALENTYTRIDNVFFVLAPKSGEVFARETLVALESLTEGSWRMPYSNRVDSVTNFQYAHAEGDDLIVEDLAENSNTLSDRDLERIKGIALSEPQLVNFLISSSGHVTGIDVNILLPGKSDEEVSAVASFAREMAKDFRKDYPDIDIYLTGSVMSDNAFGEASARDMTVLNPIMLLVLVVITGCALRSAVGTIATLAIILFSMFTGMGIAGWQRMSITVASANAPMIILTLAIADSVHILATVFNEMRGGRSKYDAIVESLRINLQPVFLTSITTAIGFLSMNLSDAPPFRDLGNIVATGVMMAFFYSILFLPSLIAILPVRVKPKDAGELVCPACDRFATFVIKRRKQVFIAMVAAIILLALGIVRIELGDDWIKYFSKSFDIRKATDFMEENLSGFHMIEYSLESGETGGINNPEYLATVEKFANWYRRQPKVVNVSAITNTMKRLNKNMHGDDMFFYRIPERRDLAAQYLLLYEMSLPFGLDLNNLINIDKSATRMIVILRDITTSQLRNVEREGRTWLRENAPEKMFTYGSGLSIIWAHISGRNIRSMLGASFWALILISVILVLAFRNVRLGLLSLIPNLAPALMAFGLWGFFVRRVGLGLSVIAAMTLGIVVDDTVHFMSKFLRARREHSMNPQDAVRYAFNTVGTAMWITTVALVAGFLVLAFSGYKMNAEMGILSAITITLALVMDFLLLPTLLMKAEEKRNE
ncbi:MAG: MMPL family transporter [Candidatus Omnitrophota bacterium]